MNMEEGAHSVPQLLCAGLHEACILKDKWSADPDIEIGIGNPGTPFAGRRFLLDSCPSRFEIRLYLDRPKAADTLAGHLLPDTIPYDFNTGERIEAPSRDGENQAIGHKGRNGVGFGIGELEGYILFLCAGQNGKAHNAPRLLSPCLLIGRLPYELNASAAYREWALRRKRQA